MTRIYLALFGAASFAVADGFEAKIVDGERQEFAIQLTTVEQFTAMCWMDNTQVTISRELQGLETKPVVGTIEVTSEVNQAKPCLMAAGPNRGAIHLKKGELLPSVMGEFNLKVNGHDVGSLLINESDVQLRQ